MHEAIGWSYDLLQEPERRLFCRLSVFVGSFSLDAVRFVSTFPGAPAGEDETLALITTLVDSSLVQPMTGQSSPRYWMYEPLRDFAIDRMVDAGMDHDARDAHAAYYLKLGEDAEPGLEGPNQVSWLATLDIEHGNLHEALTWLTAVDRVSEAVTLSYNLFWATQIHARHTEARQFLRAWLKRPELRPPTPARALALFAEGLLEANVYEASATSTLREALDLFRQLGDEIHEMRTLIALGYAHSIAGELGQAQIYLEECLRMTKRIGNARCKALVLIRRGQLHRERGELPHALQDVKRALAVAREAGDMRSIGIALGELGRLELVRGEDLGRALDLVNESMAIEVVLGNKRNLPVRFEELAEIARAQGDLDKAEAHYRSGLAICQETGQLRAAAFFHLGLATIARLRNQSDAWRDELRHAIHGFSANSLGVNTAECLMEFAMFAQMVGDAPAAARFLGAAKAIAGPSTSLPMPNWTPGMHAHLIDEVRADLGEEGFEKLCAEGRGWPPDDAIAAALAYAPYIGPPAQEALHGPDHGLSRREMEVLRLMASGLSNQRIADDLSISVRTVGNHVTNILGKLDVTSRTSAVSFAIRSGIA
jgi:ATP/maltotriose-dependent transcriptional regulator MalT